MGRICIVTLALLLISCGKKEARKVGGNNGDDNNEMMDAGPEDAGADANVDPEDTSTPDEDQGTTDMSTPPEDAGPDLGSDMATDSGADSGTDTGPDMPPDMDGCPDESRQNGAACDCDDQCSGGVCLDADPQQGIEGFCSQTCTNRDDCGQDEVCMFDPSGTNVCRPDDTGVACTDNGTFSPGDCSQACLQAGSNHQPRHYCSVPCQTSDDCKLGHACAPVLCRQGNDGLSCVPSIVALRAGSDKDMVLMNFPVEVDLCVPMGAMNPCNFPTDQFACASALCDDDQTKCTAQCLTNDDCAAGGCVDLDVSDPDLPIRFCDLLQ